MWRNFSVLDFAEKLGDCPFFLVVQRGLALVLPLIMVGALALLLLNFPFPLLPHTLDTLFGPLWRAACENLVAGSFGITSLTILCSFSGSMTMFHNQGRKGHFVSPIMAIVVVLSCFFVVTSPAQTISWKAVFSMDRGLMVALCVAFAGCRLFLWLAHFRLLQLPLRAVGNDPVVRDILTVMPAGMMTIAAFGVVRAFLVAAGITDLYGVVCNLLAALFAGMGDNLVFAMTYTGLSQLLWFFGAHGPNLLFPVEESILVPASIANHAAMLLDKTPTFIFTKPFFDAFTRMGGSGGTLSLIGAILLGSRNSGSRKLCLFALLPALCNVNEPLLFGIPLVLNPVYLIPFFLTPIIQALTAYGATVMELVPRTITEVVWTTPVLISGFSATNSVAGAVMQVANLVLGAALYFPFVRFDDHLRERRGKRVLDALMETATGCVVGTGGRKCLDRPGEEGRLAKALANDIQDALNHDDQLFLEYQPQIDAGEGRVVGVEALLRWKHPVYGRIPPPVAVALAEDTDCIDQLGLFVLNRACITRAAWKGLVPDDVVISVNVSPQQLIDPHFNRKIMDTLTLTGLLPGQLEVEITESTVLVPETRTMDSLRSLRDIGVRVAIDDFGMGHVSLRYLREFPVDTIKIDRSLTEASPGNINEHIVRSIVELSHTIGIKTVVEGVERKEQLERFLQLGCKTFQGYLFSRPLSDADCLTFICKRYDESPPDPFV